MFPKCLSQTLLRDLFNVKSSKRCFALLNMTLEVRHPESLTFCKYSELGMTIGIASF